PRCRGQETVQPAGGARLCALLTSEGEARAQQRLLYGQRPGPRRRRGGSTRSGTHGLGPPKNRNGWQECIRNDVRDHRQKGRRQSSRLSEPSSTKKARIVSAPFLFFNALNSNNSVLPLSCASVCRQRA